MANPRYKRHPVTGIPLVPAPMSQDDVRGIALELLRTQHQFIDLYTDMRHGISTAWTSLECQGYKSEATKHLCAQLEEAPRRLTHEDLTKLSSQRYSLPDEIRHDTHAAYERARNEIKTILEERLPAFKQDIKDLCDAWPKDPYDPDATSMQQILLRTINKDMARIEDGLATFQAQAEEARYRLGHSKHGQGLA